VLCFVCGGCFVDGVVGYFVGVGDDVVCLFVGFFELFLVFGE